MKKIPLVHGKGVAIVDDEDYELLFLARWYNVRGYARRVVKYVKVDGKWKRTWRYMHQDILPAPTGLEVDHIDRDPLNNRRDNLRLVTRTKQMHNNGARGVYWSVERNKWVACIMRNGVKRQKRFDSKQAAQLWRQMQAEELS